MKDLALEFGLKKRKAFEYVRMERKVRFRGKRLHYEETQDGPENSACSTEVYWEERMVQDKNTSKRSVNASLRSLYFIL